MMTCTDIRTRLSSWVDDEVDQQVRGAIEEHLEVCADCAGLAADLTRLKDAASRLGPVAPPDHVWLEVAGQVRLEEVSTDRREASAGSRRSSAQWLGLAAALLMVTGGLWLLSRTAPPEPEPVMAEAAAADVVAAELDLAVQHYERAIATLETMAAAGDLPVEPAITATLRENLGVVDQAIADSRQALEQDPTNQPARESLFDALRQKVGLLQATVVLMNEIRKGNPDAALSATGPGRSL